MDKKELKQPDAFISTSHIVLAFIERHAKSISSLVLIGVLGAIGYLGYGYWNASRERAAAAVIYEAEAPFKLVQKRVEDERQAKLQEATASKKPVGNPDDLRPIDFEKDFKAPVEKLISAIKETRQSRTALLTAMSLAQFLGEQKKWSLAEEVLAIPQYKPSSKELLGGLFNLHKGLVNLELNKTDEAIRNYEEIVQNKSLTLVHPEAYLKLGISYEAKKDLKKAREIYEKVIQDFASTESATQAQQFLKLLSLRGAA